MTQLRFVLARCLMVMLMVLFVMGTFRVDTTSQAGAAEVGHGLEDMAQAIHDCPTAEMASGPMSQGHAVCKMTACCFSDIPNFSAVQPEFRFVPASHVQSAEGRLTQTEPERAKKPPKYT